MLIGLTGGFLTGKSTFLKFLKRKGFKTLQVDSLYGKLLKEAFLSKRLVKEFGKDILVRGGVSKKKLREKLFLKPSLLKKLNRITHPFIIKELKRLLKVLKRGKTPVIVEVPLLYEAKIEALFDKVIVVSSSQREQFKRAKALGYAPKEAKIFIQNQLPLKIKEEKADWVIKNTTNIAELRKKAYQLAKEILSTLPIRA